MTLHKIPLLSRVPEPDPLASTWAKRGSVFPCYYRQDKKVSEQLFVHPTPCTSVKHCYSVLLGWTTELSVLGFCHEFQKVGLGTLVLILRYSTGIMRWNIPFFLNSQWKLN